MYCYFKTGTISEYDPSTGYARVKFSDDDDMDGGDFVSGWLHIVVSKTLKDKHTIPFDVDEQVACMVDEHCEEGVILGAIYSNKDKPSGAGEDIHRMEYSDGSYVEFDRSTGHYNASFKGNCIIESGGGKIDLKATDVTVYGDLTVTGDIGSNGNIKAALDVEAGPLNVKLTTHKHLAVTPGSGTSGPATP